MLTLEHAWSVIQQDLVHWSLRLAGAIAIFYIGRWVAWRLFRTLGTVLERRKVDPTISSFLLNVGRAVALVVIILAALRTLGVETSSMLAVLGAAGLAVGLALKDSLSNIASGVLMVAFRPFEVGDFVETSSVRGKVQRISIFYTELLTPDNKMVIIPNSLVTSGVITNFTHDDNRRLELSIGVGYGSDLPAVRTLLLETLRAHPRVLAEPVPTVGVVGFGDSAVNFVLRPWVKVDDVWDATFELNEAIKRVLDEHGIEIPFPQRVLHMAGRNGDSSCASTSSSATPRA